MSDQRRCVVWVNTTTLRAAQELADLTGVDVDTFVAYVVNELHAQEVREGAMRARAEGGAEVIPIRDDQGRRRPRRAEHRRA
jgi:hypothetical protein